VDEELTDLSSKK